MKNTVKATKKSRCDCCGKRNTIIQRRFKGEGYCPNCYRTWFVKKTCDKCGESNRFHKKESVNICRKCMRLEPCIRCGRDAFKNGANTQYGRVCQTCYAGYFREKKQCFECGELKSNVSSYSALMHNQPVCISCYQKHFHETCESCRRYRKLIDTDNGRICKKCHEQGLIPCGNCNKLMPAGLGEKCWDCYWLDRLAHETKLNSYLFSFESIKNDYQEFVSWLSTNRGAKTAKLKNNNFIEFFIRCDELWGEIPSYKILVHEFKPEGLRHNLTVLRWLIDTNRVTEDLEIKSYVAEQERIIKLLNKFNSELPREVSQYYKFLMKRHHSKEIALKTVRMNLQPVIGIYTTFEIEAGYTPNQEQIDAYLLQRSGQYNSLIGFISFLNQEYDISLRCGRPRQKDIAKATRKQLEETLMQLASKPEPLTAKDRLTWYQVAMALFHNTSVSLNALKIIKPKSMNDDMQIIEYNNKDYCIPKPKRLDTS